ncbi:uncharacterized protein LOC141695742 [Apium graveolens]|uniref:uncharacterized protein LOC141695742 n=1 Tax=Apium graveolens TaxID=4045 RepID=UPI003D78D70D
MGTFIAWPKDLIAVRNNILNQVFSAPKRAKKGLAKKIKKSCKLIDEKLNQCLLWTWLSKEAFGLTKKQIMFLSDIHAVCSRGEMAGSVICLYIHFLNDYAKKNKMSSMISFVDPSTIGATGGGNATQRSHALAARFKVASKGEYFLMPCNDVNHWTLTVVNSDTEIVYYMDPLKRRIANGEWGVPVQTGNKDCGLFVMRYMKEIVHDKELDFVTKGSATLSLCSW